MSGNAAFRARRAELGLTQEELANRIDGLYGYQITQIERYGWVPPQRVRDALSAALSTTSDTLWGDIFNSDQSDGMPA